MTSVASRRNLTAWLTVWRNRLNQWRGLRYGLVWLFFLSTGWLLVQPGLHVQFFSDDLHLVRSYSEKELYDVWRGDWDPDGLSTTGYRPLTTLFNHVRYSLLGEDVAAHRLLLVAFFATYLTLVVALARLLFQAPWAAVLLGSLIVQFHLDSTYHYFWISDGIHLVVGVAVLGAILCLLYALRTEHWRWLLPSSLGVAIALLTREDSLIVYPLLLYFGVIFARTQHRWKRAWVKPLAGYGVVLASMGALFWWLRSTFVSEALAVQIDVSNFVWMLRQTSQNMGDVTNLLVWWQDYVGAIGVWLICLGFIAAVFLFLLPRAIQYQAWVWLIAVLISALPGLTLPRTNLLLFAVTFWGLFLGTVLLEFARRSHGAALAAASVITFVLLTSAWGSIVLQQDSSPANLDWICGNTAWVYGDFSHATVPESRREQMRQQLSQYGIAAPEDVGGRLPVLVQEAVAGSRYGANHQGEPFVPRISFITYPDWQPWSCATLKEGLFRVP